MATSYVRDNPMQGRADLMMTDLEMRRQPKIKTDEAVISAELDGETVLLNVDSGIYFGLGAVGTAVWRYLSEASDENSLCARLLEEFEVEPATLRADITAFLGELQANGLIQVTEP